MEKRFSTIAYSKFLIFLFFADFFCLKVVKIGKIEDFLPSACQKIAKTQNIENLQHAIVQNGFSKVSTNFQPKKMIWDQVFSVFVIFALNFVNVKLAMSHTPGDYWPHESDIANFAFLNFKAKISKTEKTSSKIIFWG